MQTVKDAGALLGPRRLRLGGLSVGPVKHLSEERARLAALEWNTLTVRRIGATIGAELSGVQLSADLPDEVIDEIRRALHEYKVIFFRNQPLTPEQHVAFGKRFGALEVHPFLPGNEGVPELVRFAKSVDVAGFENNWHHDVTWREVPSMGAILHAIEVPQSGGDTLFADMYAAYDGLDDETRELIDGLDAEHDFMRSFGLGLSPERKIEMRATYPSVVHPVAPVHEATGRRYLYVNRIFTERIVGLPDEDSAVLLARLCAEAETVEYQCRFHWEKDSIAFWDNRAVQHYAASDYWPEIRVMERASVVGTRPTR